MDGRTAVPVRVVEALACLALEPGLGGAILFDLAPDLLPPLARWLGAVRAAQTGRGTAGRGTVRPRVVWLTAGTTDDELWSSTRLAGRDGELAFARETGPLVESDPAAPPTVVAGTNLARLSLPALRAAVQVVNADAAAMERNGASARWRPRAAWLVACPGDEVGRVSAHVLDRFALRVHAGRLPRTEGGHAGGTLADPYGAAAGQAEPWWLPPPSSLRLTAPPDALRVTGAATTRAVELVDGRAPGMRRELGLVRIARALAAMDGQPVVDRSDVDRAAELIGLRPPVAAPARRPRPGRSFVSRWVEDAAARAEPRPAPPGAPSPYPEPVLAGDEPEPMAAVAVPDPDGAAPEPPYPEDEVSAQREAAPLRTPWQRRSAARAARGVIVGMARARDLVDLSITGTMLEAAKFQVARRQGRPTHANGARLIISPADLRCHRRAPEPARLLMLVLDHTCRGDWDWLPALAPYVRWGYAARAAVCVVEAGARDARHELRAQLYSTASLRDRRVAASLARPPGRATPLAHALELAAQELRRRVQHGRAAIEQAWLVVVSDGRGNVPLAASVAGEVQPPVGRAGIDDALAAGAEIRQFARVAAVVISPGGGPYRHLAFDLAEAMGGTAVTGRSYEAEPR